MFQHLFFGFLLLLLALALLTMFMGTMQPIFCTVEEFLAHCDTVKWHKNMLFLMYLSYKYNEPLSCESKANVLRNRQIFTNGLLFLFVVVLVVNIFKKKTIN